MTRKAPAAAAKSRHLRTYKGKKQLLLGHAISHASTWRKAVGKTKQKKDIAFFHRELRKKGLKVLK